MTIIYSGAPGSASNTLKNKLESILNCNAQTPKAGKGIGHLAINIPPLEKILQKLKLGFLKKKPKLIYGHIFPTEFNMTLLNRHYDIKEIIISYRNIYDQINYFYKWQKYRLKGPLTFVENPVLQKKNKFTSDNFDIDLNLLLLLNFYKQWFGLIQNHLIHNVTLISFDEIVSNNASYQEKILFIYKDRLKYNGHIRFDEKIEANVFEKEKFVIHPRHLKMIEEFITFNNNIDFSLITN